jgi:uncharacterized membrane protein
VLMKPLIVLLASFMIALMAIKILDNRFDYALAARIAMAVMLIFTSIAHFVFTRGMAMMIPPFLPFKTGLVYFTGIIEIIAAIGLLTPVISVATGWLLMAFFALLLPANIYAAIKRIDYQKGTFNGRGLSYLWVRVPLQILFIVWTYMSSIRN